MRFVPGQLTRGLLAFIAVYSPLTSLRLMNEAGRSSLQ